jgi:predicted enzyme related to lactoylglutathione lyase
MLLLLYRGILTGALFAGTPRIGDKIPSTKGAIVPNTICHFEIGCRDRSRTKEFFNELFDWKMADAVPATFIETGDAVGGHITSLGHEPHNYAIFYVKVDDVKTYLEKATALGGKTLVGPLAIPTGTFAWFADPEGNTIGLFQENK